MSQKPRSEFGPPPDKAKAVEWVAAHWLEARELIEAAEKMRKRAFAICDAVNAELDSLVSLGVLKLDTAYRTSKGVMSVYPGPGGSVAAVVSAADASLM